MIHIWMSFNQGMQYSSNMYSSSQIRQIFRCCQKVGDSALNMGKYSCTLNVDLPQQMNEVCLLGLDHSIHMVCSRQLCGVVVVVHVFDDLEAVVLDVPLNNKIERAS